MLELSANSTFDHLDPEARSKLIELLEKRSEYHLHQAELGQLRIAAINNPTPEKLQALEAYSEEHMSTLRHNVAEMVAALVRESIDIDAIKAMLPMILMGLVQSIDVPLLMAALGVDQDLVTKLVSEAKDYFQNGM